MKVDQLMTREIEVCKAHETLNRAAQLMWERDCGFIPVIASNGDGALVGVITDRDIAMATLYAAICEPRFVCESSLTVDLEYVE